MTWGKKAFSGRFRTDLFSADIVRAISSYCNLQHHYNVGQCFCLRVNSLRFTFRFEGFSKLQFTEKDQFYLFLKKTEDGILCLNTRTAHTESIEYKTKTSYISFVRVFLPRLTTETCNFFAFLCSLCDGKWPSCFGLPAACLASILYLHWTSCCICHDLRYLWPIQSLQV